MKKISILFVLFSLFSVRNTQPFIEPVTFTIFTVPVVVSATITLLKKLSTGIKVDDEFATIEDSEESNTETEYMLDIDVEAPDNSCEPWKILPEVFVLSSGLLQPLPVL